MRTTTPEPTDLQGATAGDAAARPGPKGPTPLGVWLQPALVALVLASAFIACYIGLQRDPTPHRMPVAVLGSNLSEQVQNALGDTVATRPSGSAAAAHTALEDRDVVAVLAQDAPGRLALHVAGANGLSTTTAVENLVTAYAQRAGQGPSITDDSRSPGTTPGAWPASTSPSASPWPASSSRRTPSPCPPAFACGTA